MHKRTKATSIPKHIKREVYERDGKCCIACGRRGEPNAHYINRAQGGLGIVPWNIATLCIECHGKFDGKHDMEWFVIHESIVNRMCENYNDWDNLPKVYEKGKDSAEDYGYYRKKY